MTDKLKIGIVGTGNIASSGHGPAFLNGEHVKLWSVCSRDMARAIDFAKRFGATSPKAAYVNLEEMLSDPSLDAVLITSPDRLHFEHALQAIRAKKHVLLEKPATTNVEEGLQLEHESKLHDVRVGIAYHMRWHSGHRQLHAAVAKGSFGVIRHIRAHWSWHSLDSSNWRASEDLGRWWSLAGVGTHMLDQIRWFMVPSCGEVTKLSSLTANSVWKGPHDEIAIVAMQFENGSTAEFCSSALFESPTRFEVYGEVGFAIAENTLGRHGAGRIITGLGLLEFEVKNPFTEQLDGFAKAITMGVEPEVGIAEGARNVELLSQVG